MKWLRKLIGAVPDDELVGIALDPMGSHWLVEGSVEFCDLFRALDGWLPEGSILYLEGGSPDAEIEGFMAEHMVPEQIHVAMGTIWPRPKVYHVPATTATLNSLADIMEHHAEPELAWHIHVYRNNAVMIAWYDASSDPFWISGGVAEEKVRVLADRLGRKYWKESLNG